MVGGDIYVTTDNMGQSVENQAITQDASKWLGVRYLVVKIMLTFTFHPSEFHAVPAGLCTFLIPFCPFLIHFFFCIAVEFR